MIYILSDAIRTGKTTALFNWCAHKENVDGLLCPDDDKGMRYFFKIKSKEKFQLEVESASEYTIRIGPFVFLKSAFSKAVDFLITFVSEEEKQYVIIDELGKLELKNKGLHAAAKRLIPKFMMHKKRHLILVVRTSLLNDIIKHYDINEYTLITREYLAKNRFA